MGEQAHQQTFARGRSAGQLFQQVRPAQLPGLAQQVLGDLLQRAILIQQFPLTGSPLLFFIPLESFPR